MSLLQRVLSAAVLVAALVGLMTTTVLAQPVPTVDLKALVSRANLNYNTPVVRSHEGMPVGTGRMGSLVWTTPNALKFQINRADVFAQDSSTTSFPRIHTEYSSGCAFVDLTLADYAPPIFAGKAFSQQLDVFDALVTARGDGVTARVLACVTGHDVMAIEIDDRRPQPLPANIDLRMLRFSTQFGTGSSAELAREHAAVVRTGNHTATSRLHTLDNGRIALSQVFREGEHYCASAVVAAVVGRESKAWYANESTVRLSTAPLNGKYVVLVSSAASMDPKVDVVAMAQAEVDAAIKAGGFEKLLSENQVWWHDFWTKGYVDLHSADGAADRIAQGYAYFLYVMASCSRGSYPPRFGGLLFQTDGDLRQWGAQFWWANQSCYYNGMAALNRWELMDPTFAMYTRMYDASATAAKQQWGSQGIWIAETTPFEGFDPLPEDIAAEMQDLYLLRKPWDQRSERFKRFAAAQSSHGSRWNWMAGSGKWIDGQWVRDEKGASPFGHVTHIFGTTAKIAYLYWQRYEYTMDEKWLRERAYPMMKGTIEFYRNFPNLRKDSDGKYHIYHTNSNEPAWGVKDSDEDMSAMHGMIGPLIRASEILGIDADLRPKWKEFAENLAPQATSDSPDAIKPENYTGPRVWIKGCRPAAKAGGLLPDGNTLPEWNFELCTLENPDAETMRIANATLDGYSRRRGAPGGPTTEPATTQAGLVTSPGSISVLSRVPIAAAAMGRSEMFKSQVVRQLGHIATPEQLQADRFEPMMRNWMSLREGPGAIECERLGRIAEAVHTALLQANPPHPGEDAIIRVFPAWPKEWDASFKLLTRGAFLVSASMKGGNIEWVRIESQAGAECRIRNPWPGARVKVVRGGKSSEIFEGELLRFSTAKAETVVLTR